MTNEALKKEILSWVDIAELPTPSWREWSIILQAKTSDSVKAKIEHFLYAHNTQDYVSTYVQDTIDVTSEDGTQPLDEVLDEVLDEYDFVERFIKENKNTMLQLDVYPSEDESIPYISDMDSAIADYSESMNGGRTTDESAALSYMMRTLRVNPSEVEIELNKVFKDDLFFESEWENIRYDNPVVTVSDFAREMENAPYGGALVFTVTESFGNIVGNIDTLHSNGIVVDKDVNISIHDWVQGSCGIGMKSTSEVKLEDADIMSRGYNIYGYSLDEVTGSTDVLWKGDVHHARSDSEMEYLWRLDVVEGLLEKIKGTPLLKHDGFKSFFVENAERTLFFLRDKVNSEPFSGDFDACECYFPLHNTPELQRENDMWFIDGALQPGLNLTTLRPKEAKILASYRLH